VEGCQKSLSHRSWPPIVTNRYDIANNGEDRTEKQNTEIIVRKPVAYTVHTLCIKQRWNGLKMRNICVLEWNEVMCE